MNRYSSYLHDLNNKLTILYGALRSCKNGNIPKDEKIEAVKSRIQDILRALNSEFQFEESQELEFLSLSCEEFRECLVQIIDRLKLIYIETNISFKEIPSDSKSNQYLKIENKLLYQILENAIENSVNANSSSIEITLSQNLNFTTIDILDNGTGFLTQSELKRESSKTSGMGIILENMKSMDAEASYSRGQPQGVKLTLLFRHL
jgi:signal transduction histidine kinase